MSDTDTVQTKVRTLRVKDELWERAQEVAAEQSEAVADVIRRALHAYTADPTAFNVAVAQIRGGAR